MALRWERPANVPRGQVWSRFKGRELNGKAPNMYQIRDMEETDRKQCLDMIQETFLRDEPLCDILNIPSDPPSIATIRSNWEAFADQGICIACYTEVDGEPRDLVGFNILLVKTKDDEEEDLEKVKGEPWKKLLKTLTAAENLVNVFEHYDVDTYLTSSGLTVLPEHRGQNIGARLIEARKPICKAFNIHAACTVFTAITSQVLAAKCGYEVLAELDYKDMLKHGVDLEGSTTPSAFVMGIKYEFS
ncbi:uncharacterized protein [Epargyreus clarus]|uniref:uncharacterized protein n=1 Tax=Epargyreus clarus TaxID=520877 RepID=UPI003C2D8020